MTAVFLCANILDVNNKEIDFFQLLCNSVKNIVRCLRDESGLAHAKVKSGIGETARGYLCHSPSAVCEYRRECENTEDIVSCCQDADKGKWSVAGRINAPFEGKHPENLQPVTAERGVQYREWSHFWKYQSPVSSEIRQDHCMSSRMEKNRFATRIRKSKHILYFNCRMNCENKR